MNKLRDYIEHNPLAELEERSESLIVRIRKGETCFQMTVPTEIHELFWQISQNEETIFEDWSDYYEGEPEDQKAEMESDSIKILDAFSKAESIRVKTEGKVLKTKKLMIFHNGAWKELVEEIAGEPVGGEE